MGRGTTDCKHAQRKGRPPAEFWWCALRQCMISPARHCDGCMEYERAERDQKGAVAVEQVEQTTTETARGQQTHKLGIDWDGPAGETVDGAPMDTPLWQWARDRARDGDRGTQREIAELIGCSSASVRSAIRRRDGNGGKAVSPSPQPSPGGRGGKGDGAEDPFDGTDLSFTEPDGTTAEGTALPGMVVLGDGRSVTPGVAAMYVGRKGLSEELWGFALGYEMGQQQQTA